MSLYSTWATACADATDRTDAFTQMPTHAAQMVNLGFIDARQAVKVGAAVSAAQDALRRSNYSEAFELRLKMFDLLGEFSGKMPVHAVPGRC